MVVSVVLYMVAKFLKKFFHFTSREVVSRYDVSGMITSRNTHIAVFFNVQNPFLVIENAGKNSSKIRDLGK